MLASGAVSSTVNLLRVEHPRSVEIIYNKTYLFDNSTEIWEPASSLRQLAHQHQLAQDDLPQFRQICGGHFNRNDHSIWVIKQNYEILFQDIRYIYEQAKVDGGA